MKPEGNQVVESVRSGWRGPATGAQARATGRAPRTAHAFMGEGNSYLAPSRDGWAYLQLQRSSLEHRSRLRDRRRTARAARWPREGRTERDSAGGRSPSTTFGHGLATLLFGAGVAPRVVMEILGHSQIAVTMNIYTHVADSGRREAMGHMDRLLRRRRPAE